MEVKKNPKADVGRGSIIFFQIGLILMLAFTYFSLEWKTTEKSDVDTLQLDLPEEDQEDIPITQMELPPPPPPPPPPAMPEIINVVEDEMEVEEDVIRSTETNQDEEIQIVEVSDIVEDKIEETVEDVPFVLVANVPVYPGCENEEGNEAKKECMSRKIEEFVRREFDTGIGNELGLFGINRIIVVFRINEKGDVVDIKSRGPHRLLEEEAERVVSKLPHMTPGRQRNKAVGVVYSLPIVFDVRESS